MPTTTEAYVVRGHEGAGSTRDKLEVAPITLETVHYEDIGAKEVLVETVAASMCHTDLVAASGIFHQKPPMILGHEGSGIVKAVGSDVASVKPGDHVVLSYSSCSNCQQCHSGRAPYCDNLFNHNFSGKRLDGSSVVTDSSGNPLGGLFFGQSSLSRMALAHETSVIQVDATREELKKFASLGCGIQTGAGTIFNIIQPPPHSSIVVFGAGAVGLAACLAALLFSPAKLILIDISQTKLDIVPSSWCTHRINSTGLSPAEIGARLKELTGGRGVDYAVDCAGAPVIWQAAVQGMRPTGMFVAVPGGTKYEVMSMPIRGFTFRMTHQGDSVARTMVPYMIDMWRQGKFPFDKMLKEYSFTDLNRAIEDVKAGTAIKPVLIP